MKTAIIGLGTIGFKVADNLVRGGERIIVADRNLPKTQSIAAKLGENAQAKTADAALAEADIVILAIMFEAIKEFVASHREALEGKIVVDPSNPVAPNGKGGLDRTLPMDQSSGQVIASLLPNGAKLVKAFGTLSAPSLTAGANRKPQRAVLFYATDYPEAGRAVSELITASGFDPVSVGGIDQSIRIEAFGDLHEFGKLGRLVTVEEARAAM